jgi:D-tyrosyl-tRNA(Tyr) deacylase
LSELNRPHVIACLVILGENTTAVVNVNFVSTKKGNRPSYTRAARPEIAIPLYDAFSRRLTEGLGKAVRTGEFGADMKVSLVNDGPVTIVIDSKNRE